MNTCHMPSKDHPGRMVIQMGRLMLGSFLVAIAVVSAAHGQTKTALVNQPMSSATFVNIYWDSNWDSDNASVTREAIDQVTQGIISSSYVTGLSEYGVTSVSYAGGFLPDPHCQQQAPSSVGFFNPFGPSIAGFIACEHDNGPALFRQLGVVYNVILPPSSMESDFWTQNFCSGPGSPVAWHYHGLPGYFPPFNGQPIYTIVQSNPQCGGNAELFDSLFHEMVEAMTDPYPVNISIIPPKFSIAGQNEIADLCEGKDVNMFLNTVSITAPSYWSNKKQKCVNFKADVYLLYDRAAGLIDTFLSPLPFASQPASYSGQRTSWSNVVGGNFGGNGMGDFLFYDTKAGVAEFFSTDETGQNLTLMKEYTDWSPGTTSIVAGNFGGTSTTGQSDLLLYNATYGFAGFFDVWGQGNINAMKGYSDWSPGTTSIVAGNFGGTSTTGQSDLLLYNAAYGFAGFFDVWGQGNINAMKGYNNWSPGTTNIVAGNFGGSSVTGQSDLLLYNATYGFAGFFDVWGQGNINAMKGYNNWSRGWTQIIAGNFGGTGVTGQSDLLLYNPTYQWKGFLDVWGQGNINGESGYLEFPSNAWTLLASTYNPVL